MDNMVAYGEDLVDFDPMKDHFNTDDNYFPRGPDNRRLVIPGQQSGGHEDLVRLHIGRIPHTLSEKGLQFLLNKAAKPNNLYLVQTSGKFKFGFAEYSSLKDALCVIQTISGIPPHNLVIDFANPVKKKARQNIPTTESVCASGSLSDVDVTPEKCMPDVSSFDKSKLNSSPEVHEVDTSLSRISIDSKSQTNHNAAISQHLKSELQPKDSNSRIEQSEVLEQPISKLGLGSEYESPRSESVKSKGRGILWRKKSLLDSSTPAPPGLVENQVSPADQNVSPRTGAGRGKWLLESRKMASVPTTQCSPTPKMTSELAGEKLSTHLNLISSNSWGFGRGVLNKRVVTGMLRNERQGCLVYCHNPAGFNRPVEYGYCHACGRVTGQHCSVCCEAVCSMSCAPSLPHHSSDSEGNLICLRNQ